MKKKDAEKKNKQIPQQPRQVAKQLYAPEIRYAVLAALAGFVLYANTIVNLYVLDDAAVIANNQYVMKGIKGIPALFTQDIWRRWHERLGMPAPPLIRLQRTDAGK